MTHSSSTTHKNDVWVGILLCHIQEGGYVTFFLVHITHHSYVWHDSFTCVTWLIHTCDMTRSYGWSDSFLCVVWLIPLAQHMKMMCEWVFYCEHIQEGGYVTLFQCIPQIITLCHMTFFFFPYSHKCDTHRNESCIPQIITLCHMTYSHLFTYSHKCNTHRNESCIPLIITLCDMTHSQ